MRTGRSVFPFAACLVLIGSSVARGGDGPTAGSTQSAMPEAVAIVGGEPITVTQLEEKIAAELRELRAREYDMKRQVLDDLIDRALIERGALKRKVSAEEFTRSEVEARVPPVTAEEVKAVYTETKERWPGLSEARALERIGTRLREQRVRERRLEFDRELRAKTVVKVLLAAPRVARVSVDPRGGPARGPETAPVTVVEFADYQCPACSVANSALDRIRERYGDRIRLVFRNFPLPNHKDAAKAAEAAACAREQGKFWEMHAKLFANEGNLQVAQLKRYAAEIGLETGAFGACLDSGRTAAAWRKDMEDGTRHGVRATPTFFVNGIPMEGVPPYEGFTRVIDEELEGAGERVATKASREAGRP